MEIVTLKKASVKYFVQTQLSRRSSPMNVKSPISKEIKQTADHHGSNFILAHYTEIQVIDGEKNTVVASAYITNSQEIACSLKLFMKGRMKNKQWVPSVAEAEEQHPI